MKTPYPFEVRFPAGDCNMLGWNAKWAPPNVSWVLCEPRIVTRSVTGGMDYMSGARAAGPSVSDAEAGSPLVPHLCAGRVYSIAPPACKRLTPALKIL